MGLLRKQRLGEEEEPEQNVKTEILQGSGAKVEEDRPMEGLGPKRNTPGPST